MTFETMDFTVISNATLVYSFTKFWLHNSKMKDTLLYTSLSKDMHLQLKVVMMKDFHSCNPQKL